MGNIFIVNETLNEANRLKEILEAKYYNVVGVSNCYNEAKYLYQKLEIDILIVDVFLNSSTDGLQFVESLSIGNREIQPFIFLTNSTRTDLYDRLSKVNPFSIINKPYNELEILYTLDRIQERIKNNYTFNITNVYPETKAKLDFIFVRKKNALHKITFSEIIFIEVENRYCNIYTQKEKYVVLMSLSKVNDLLDPSMFLQTHRKYIVNINMIEKIMLKDNLLILKGDHRIILSSKYRSLLNSFTILK